MDSPIATSFDHQGGLSSTNSTVSSPPNPRTPPAVSVDAYPYYKDYMNPHDEAAFHPQQAHHQHQQYDYPTASGNSGETISGPLPSSPGYPLHPVSRSGVHYPHASSATNSPPKDHFNAHQQHQYPTPPATEYSNAYGMPPPMPAHNGPVPVPIPVSQDIPRQGSYSSSVSSVGGGYIDEYAEEAPPLLEKAPLEIVGSSWHHSQMQPPHQPPQHPPPSMPYQSVRRGSYLGNLYEEAEPTPHMARQMPPLVQSMPSPDLASRGGHGGPSPLPRISQFSNGGNTANANANNWTPTSISPQLNHSPSPPTTLNGPFISQQQQTGQSSSYGSTSSSYPPPAGGPPPFARRYSTPMVQRSDEGLPPSVGPGGYGLHTGPPSNTSPTYQQGVGEGYGGFSRSYETQEPISGDRYGHHSLQRQPSMPHISSGRDYHHQPSLSHPTYPQSHPPPLGLAEQPTRFMQRSNSLPVTASDGGSIYSLADMRHSGAPGGWAPPQPAAVGPIVHTDDAASKETANLRRKCYNCSTTEPPSWRRSTLTPGKIVCNRCGLYERTHLRPRPSGSGGELRKTAGTRTSTGISPGNPYNSAPLTKNGAPMRTSKKHHDSPPMDSTMPHIIPPPPPALQQQYASAQSDVPLRAIAPAQ